MLKSLKAKAALAAVLLSAAPAMASERTVTLTQSELASVMDAQAATGAAMQAQRVAAPAMDKIKKAFAPAQPEPGAGATMSKTP